MFDKTTELECVAAAYQTIGDLLKTHAAEKIAKVVLALNGVSRNQLDKELMKARLGGNRVSAWLINQEFTRRGIHPIFRNLEDPNDDDRSQLADLFWYDLDWLATKYRLHRPFFKRWLGIFRGGSFHSTAKFAFGPRQWEMWRYGKGLALTTEQQVELHYIKREGLRRYYDQLKRESPGIQATLRAAHYARGLKLLTPEEKAIIQRRLDVWLCGSLVAWSPQRTANLYEGKTGIPMTRQQARNVMEDIWRDVENTKPRKKKSACSLV